MDQIKLPSSDVLDGSNLQNNSLMIEACVVDPCSSVVSLAASSTEESLSVTRSISAGDVALVSSVESEIPMLQVSASQGRENAMDQGNNFLFDYVILLGIVNV